MVNKTEILYPVLWPDIIENFSDVLDSDFALWAAIFGYSFQVIFGYAGNILAFLVMISPRMRKHSFSVYLAVLSVVDSFILLYSLLLLINLIWKQILKHNSVLIGVSYSYALCLFVEVMGDITHMISSALVVLTSLERFLVVTLPFIGRRVCQRSFAKKLTAMFIVIAFITNIYYVLKFVIWKINNFPFI